MYDDIVRAGIKVVLVQVDEAHSSAWPMSLPDQPEPQSTFEERIDRANEFVRKYVNFTSVPFSNSLTFISFRYNCPFEVYVDGWDNEFEQTFQAWPDKYHALDGDLKVIAKAEYHRGNGDGKEAAVVEDYVDLLKRLIR